MMLALVFLMAVDLEQQRLEAALNPPREYRTVEGKKYWLEPHPTMIGVTDPALGKGLEDKKYSIYLIDKKDLIKEKLDSSKLRPVYTYQGQLIVIDRKIMVKVKDKNHLQDVVNHCIANKLEIKKIDKLIVEVHVTKSCAYVTSMQAGRSLEGIRGVEWSEVNVWFQLMR